MIKYTKAKNFIEASQKNYFRIVEKLLSNKDLNVHEKNDRGNTALHYSIINFRKYHTQTLKNLIFSG
jgi:ankyrin repeat protein